MKIFISHSSRDADLAGLIIDLIRSATNVPSRDIRCTSVDGYRLPGGAAVDQQLKNEVGQAEIFIGLLTPASLHASYVLFELGARWGGNLHFTPLVAAGASVRDLEAPLSSLSTLDCSSHAQLHQLVAEIALRLGVESLNAASFENQLNALARLALPKRLYLPEHSADHKRVVGLRWLSLGLAICVLLLLLTVSVRWFRVNTTVNSNIEESNEKNYRIKVSCEDNGIHHPPVSFFFDKPARFSIRDGATFAVDVKPLVKLLEERDSQLITYNKNQNDLAVKKYPKGLGASEE